MSDSDLTVDYEFLSTCESQLGSLQTTFKDIENRRDDMDKHWGAGKIADAMGDFVDNWDDYRTKLIEGLEATGKLVAETKKSFEKLDEDLAKAGKGKDGKGKGQ
ncbi:WXG100 family type VII secretion target [Streptomyces sp. NPDC057302]|uniref:WXG100 family type VII secretion target n=1 Tax=Streptomyces sp. NPDC057302 TaxID=3346094 RepID=UPI00363716B7